MSLRVVLAINGIHLEAARRLRDGQPPGEGGLEILLWEPGRLALTDADRRRWPLRLPARPLSYLLLLPWARLGLVRELRLSHLCQAGRGLRLLAHHSRHLCLLDDGLDQYRGIPRAIDPAAFPAGTPCWLFSDAPDFRAGWCGRFSCHDLGPLYQSSEAATADASSGEGSSPAKEGGTLIIDSPGVERMHSRASRLPRPWVLVPHPVAAKRSWHLPLQAGDRVLRAPPETLLPGWSGTVLVGESLMLLAALRLCRRHTSVLVCLPEAVDPQLLRLARAAAQLQSNHIVVP